MANLRVYAGSFSYSSFFFDDLRATPVVSSTATQVVLKDPGPGAFQIVVTGTGFDPNAPFTQGTITGISARGFEGTVIYTFTNLTLDGAQFGDALDALNANPANSGPLRALFAAEALNAVGDINDDELEGGSGADRLDGGWGDDFFIGNQGADTIIGGPITGSFLGDQEGPDDDTLSYQFEGGTRGIVVDLNKTSRQITDTFGTFDTVSGIEFIVGTSRADRIAGSDGEQREVFSGREGADIINGRGGLRDEVRYDRENGTLALDINLATGRAKDTYGFIDQLSGIERVRGSAFDDMIVGNGADNRFRTFAGADTIDGGAGLDLVDYQQDADRRDVAGNFGTRGVRIDLEAGLGRDGFGAVDALTSIENVIGTRFHDRLLGSAVANVFNGGGGSDLADGRAGNDSLFGEDGNDRLLGGAGADTIDGGEAADFVAGGLGNDQLTGGLGFDTFIFDAALAANLDTITDFDPVFDTIQLDDAVFTALAAGPLDADAFAVGAAATTAAQRIIYNDANGSLIYDDNGSAAGGARVFARLERGLDLTEADFMVA